MTARSSHNCKARTRQGRPCRRKAQPGSQFCFQHQKANSAAPKSRAESQAGVASSATDSSPRSKARVPTAKVPAAPKRRTARAPVRSKRPCSTGGTPTSAQERQGATSLAQEIDTLFASSPSGMSNPRGVCQRLQQRVSTTASGLSHKLEGLGKTVQSLARPNISGATEQKLDKAHPRLLPAAVELGGKAMHLGSQVMRLGGQAIRRSSQALRVGGQIWSQGTALVRGSTSAAASAGNYQQATAIPEKLTINPENRLALVNFFKSSLGTMEAMARVIKQLEQNEHLAQAAWQGCTAFVQAMQQAYQEELRRRRAGEYETDEFGYDPQFLDWVMPFLRFLYHQWWRVDTSGLEHIPRRGRVLLVVNHSGVLPWDGAMVATALREELRPPRQARPLFLRWFSSLPFISTFLQRTGGVMACPQNAARLLRQDHAVVVFPEGLKGVGKLYKTRYQLQRFGRGGFVKIALETQAPIIPVAVVGAEETYPNIMRLDALGKLLGLPYFPITPTWPWLGPLGLVPLPSKWFIHFGEPIPMDIYDPQDARDHLLITAIVRQVRAVIQEQIDTLLQKRRGIFR